MKTCALYLEPDQAANAYRNTYLKEVLSFTEKAKERADRDRNGYFTPDLGGEAAYLASIGPYREDYRRMIGMNYFDGCPAPEAAPEIIEVAQDKLGKIRRVKIPVYDGVELYGLLLTPSEQKGPLVIVQHGGDGTPELCAGFAGSYNYNEMTRRFLLRGVHVFSPQLLLYRNGQYGDEYDRVKIAATFRQLGTSIAAFEITAIERAIDWLTTLDFVDENRIAMAGLSYGGFYTLMTSAAETRIKAAYVSGYYNDRYVYNWHDMSFTGQAPKFMDNEIASLICPRPLFIESGAQDPLFSADRAEALSAGVAARYRALGLSDRFCFHRFEGVHEFACDDEGIDFIMRHI